jgi:tyrosinase
MADVLVRQNIWTLEEQNPNGWHPIVLAYALAVDKLQQRPSTNPESWTYQAAVHGTYAEHPDPTYQNQCQHGSWYFLPWHRMYLFYFESIIRSVLQTEVADEIDAQTKSSWALPYWNYLQGNSYWRLPASFITPTLPDGRPNPLLYPRRDRNINMGGLFSQFAIDADALGIGTFEGDMGFGGPRTDFMHFGNVHGQLESDPHDLVHGNVGGDMGDPNTAALDPIFWLHHANIDRLWAVWLAQGGGRANPTDPAWTTDQKFDFYDDSGTPQNLSPSQVLDSASQPMNYTYDDVSVPGPLEVQPVKPEPDHPPQSVGATDQPFRLTGDTHNVSINLSEPAGPLDAATPPARVFLRLDGLTSADVPGVPYAVFVNVPDNDQGTPKENFAGSFFPFGINLVGRRDDDHGGMTVFLDITDLFHSLNERGLWGPRVSVRFVPLYVEAPAGPLDADAEAAPGIERKPGTINVGQVSVHYQ